MALSTDSRRSSSEPALRPFQSIALRCLKPDFAGRFRTFVDRPFKNRPIRSRTQCWTRPWAALPGPICRSTLSGNQVILRFGPFCLDLSIRQLSNGPTPVRLTPKAFELLRLLVEHRPRAMSKAELVDAVWPGVFVSDEGLPRLVNEVRLALGDSVREPRWIRTVHGFGYAFLSESSADVATGRFRLNVMQRDIPLGDGEHLIGREGGASVHIAASVVSRRHARIVISGDSATLEDLDSKNGTYIGETRITKPHPLRDRDEIRIGELTLAFGIAGVTPTKTYAG